MVYLFWIRIDRDIRHQSFGSNSKNSRKLGLSKVKDDPSKLHPLLDKRNWDHPRSEMTKWLIYLGL